MSTKDKMIKKLKNSQKNITFNELQGLLVSLGFKLSSKGKTSGSRVKFQKSNIPIIFHKPHPRKELAEYQIKQILEILEKEDLI